MVQELSSFLFNTIYYFCMEHNLRKQVIKKIITFDLGNYLNNYVSNI